MRKLVIALALAPLPFIAQPAAAHEGREVGEANVVVGWATEPAFAGFLNAVQFRASHHDDGDPITGLTMKVVVSFGDLKTEALALEPVFGSEGEFRAPMTPTRPGRYTFTITGTVLGKTFEETFTSGETTFNDIGDPNEIEFPAKDPTRGELAERVERLDPRIDEVKTAAVGQADDAKGAANTAMILGIIGTLLGAGALLLTLVRRKGVPA